MEILTGVERRRRWSSEEKLEILREASAPGSSVGTVARRHDICRSQIYQWRQAFRSGRLRSESLAVVDFLPVEVSDDEDEEPVVDETLSPDIIISIELRHGRTPRQPLTLVALTMPDSRVSGQELADRDRLRLVADATSDQSRMIAVGISSLANLKIETFNIGAVWAGIRDTPLDLIGKIDNGLALVDLSKTDLGELEAMTGLQAVMKFWLTDRSQEQSQANTRPGHLLVASASVRPEFIHLLLDMVQTDSLILKAANVDIGKLDPSFSLLDMPLPHHEGVHNCLEASDIELAAVSAAHRENVDSTTGRSGKANKIATDPPFRDAGLQAKDLGNSSAPIVEKPDQTSIPNAVESAKSYTLFFETNNADLDANDFESVAEACLYAATLPNARFVISGHTDTVGSESYNIKLAKNRAEGVANAIRNDPRFREALSVIEYGESNLAVATDDDVPEARNRRVRITVVENR